MPEALPGRQTESFLPGSIAMLANVLDRWARAGRIEPAVDRLRCLDVHHVEFTIEPFVEGRPGAHVTEPIAALQALGHRVDVGPFGSSVDVPAEVSGEAVSTLVRVAFENGASHVNVDIETVEP